MRARKRLLIADAHRLWRHALRRIIEGFGSYLVVGEASDRRVLLEQAQEARPDLVLMDIALPLPDGIRALRELATVTPAPRVVILSEVVEPAIVREVFAAGALGYLTKCERLETLRRALIAASQGFSFFGPRVARALLEFLRERTSGLGASHKRLSLRELKLMELLARGRSDQAITSRLGMSLEAINYYRLHVLRRLPLESVSTLDMPPPQERVRRSV